MLSQARGSLFEVEAQALISRRLEFFDEESFDEIDRQIKRTGKALTGLIRWVQKLEQSTARPRDRATPRPR